MVNSMWNEARKIEDTFDIGYHHYGQILGKKILEESR